MKAGVWVGVMVRSFYGNGNQRYFFIYRNKNICLIQLIMILSAISGDPSYIPVSSRVTYSAALYSTGFRSQESFLFMTLSLKLCNVCVNVNSLHL